MSSLVFPDLPGLSIRRTNTIVHRTISQRTESGQELRIRRWSGPHRRYRLEYEGLRQVGVPNDEAQILIDFFNAHGGAWDSFLITDKLDGVQRRVRFEDDELELEQLANGLWRVGEVTLVTTAVSYSDASIRSLMGAASGVLLPAPDTSTWLMTVDDAGALYTGLLVAVSSGQDHADVVLVSANASRWRLTVANDGGLTTTADATSDPTTTISLASPNGKTWSVAVDADGALTTTEV